MAGNRGKECLGQATTRVETKRILYMEAGSNTYDNVGMEGGKVGKRQGR